MTPNTPPSSRCVFSSRFAAELREPTAPSCAPTAGPLLTPTLAPRPAWMGMCLAFLMTFGQALLPVEAMGQLTPINISLPADQWFFTPLIPPTFIDRRIEVTQTADWDGTENGAGWMAGDVVYTANPDYDFKAWYDTTWKSDVAGTQRLAHLLGVSSNSFPPTSPQIQEHTWNLTTLRLEDVSLSTREVALVFQSATPSLTLHNAVLDLNFAQDSHPLFSPADSTFTISPELGTTNTIGHWRGYVGGAANIVVPTGTDLTFKDSGLTDFVTPEGPTEYLYFNQTNNNIDVNGGRLLLDSSGVFVNTFDASGTKVGNFTIRNSGELRLFATVPVGTLRSLLIADFLTVSDSTLHLANNSALVGHSPSTLALRPMSQLTLNTATVEIEQGAILRATALEVSGTTTISVVGAGASPIDHSSFDSLVMSNAATSLTFNGRSQGRLFVGTPGTNGGAVTFWDFNGGTLTIADPTGNPPGTLQASLQIGQEREGPGQVFETVSVSPRNANIVVSGANAELRIGEAGSLVQNGAASAGGMNLTLQSGASLVVENGGAYSGFGEIGGGLNETVTIEAGGELRVVKSSTQPGTLTINPSLSMSDIATLGLSIFPTLGLSDVLVTKGALTLGNLTTLDLSIAGTDTTLPLGFKLLLVDYSDTNSFTGRFDLPYRDGSIFDLGANEFQILYEDPDYGAAYGGNSSVITLTTVPEPSTWAMVLCGLACLAVWRLRRRESGRC